MPAANRIVPARSAREQQEPGAASGSCRPSSASPRRSSRRRRSLQAGSLVWVSINIASSRLCWELDDGGPAAPACRYRRSPGVQALVPHSVISSWSCAGGKFSRSVGEGLLDAGGLSAGSAVARAARRGRGRDEVAISAGGRGGGEREHVAEDDPRSRDRRRLQWKNASLSDRAGDLLDRPWWAPSSHARRPEDRVHAGGQLARLWPGCAREPAVGIQLPSPAGTAPPVGEDDRARARRRPRGTPQRVGGCLW